MPVGLPDDLRGRHPDQPPCPDGTGTVASVMIEVDLPPGVEITGYERHQEGHGFEVRWPLPERCRCQRCGHEDRAHIEYKTSPQAVRDLDVWGQPGFWIYQAPFHRCARCNYRQHLIPPFKRKDTAYTSRFEQFVLRSLIGSTAEDVARRLGISAETVERIVEYQLAEQRQIDPERVITDIGLDELSLKNRLSEEQRRQGRTHRGGLGAADPAARAQRLKQRRAVADRFHGAKKFN